MTASKECQEMIKKFEGLRLVRYNDIGGIATIGYGHTGENLPASISPREAEEYFLYDLMLAENEVNMYVGKPYSFTQNEYDALVSFAFNVGSIKKLTDMGNRSKTDIAEKMIQYVNVGGKPVKGLINRRQEERALFLKDMTEKSLYCPKIKAIVAGTIIKVRSGTAILTECADNAEIIHITRGISELEYVELKYNSGLWILTNKGCIRAESMCGV